MQRTPVPPRVTSDAGVSALLGAVTGFLLVDSDFLRASAPVEALRVAGIILAYFVLFAVPPYFFWALFTLKEQAALKALMSVAACTGYVWANIVVIRAVSIWQISQGDTVSITAAYASAASLFLLPILWLVAHLADSVQAKLIGSSDAI